MNKFIVITADINDGDYVTESTKFNEELLEKLKNIFNKMPKSLNGTIRYETKELGDDDKSDSDYQFITPEEKEFLSKFLPIGDPNYCGIHTIEKVEIMQLIEKII